MVWCGGAEQLLAFDCFYIGVGKIDLLKKVGKNKKKVGKSMSLDVKAFHPSSYGYNRDLLLTRKNGASLLSKTEHHSFSNIKPLASKDDVGHCIWRENKNTGYKSQVFRDKWLIKAAEAAADGVELHCNDGKTDLTRRVLIKDNGTNLDLLIKDGKVMKYGPEGVEIGKDLTKISPLTRKWLKQVIDFLGKVK